MRCLIYTGFPVHVYKYNYVRQDFRGAQAYYYTHRIMIKRYVYVRNCYFLPVYEEFPGDTCLVLGSINPMDPPESALAFVFDVIWAYWLHLRPWVSIHFAMVAGSPAAKVALVWCEQNFIELSTSSN